MNLCSAAHIRSSALILLLCAATLSYGQRLLQGSKAGQKVSQSKEVLLDKQGSPQFIRFEKGMRMDSLPTFRKMLELPERSALQLKSKSTDPHGEVHMRYTQTYDGLEVLGAEYIVHTKGQNAISANGSVLKEISLNTQPSITREAALQLALDQVQAEVYMWESEENEQFLKQETKDAHASFHPQSRLVLSRRKYDKGQPLNLVYQFDIYAQQPLGRYNVEIDAHSGEVINIYNKIHTIAAEGTGQSLYDGVVPILLNFDGGTYYLSDDSTGGGIYTYDLKHGTSYGSATLFSEPDSHFDQTNSQAGVSAHFGAAATYGYFSENFGRDSYDDAGARIRSYVHYSTGYFNAFWDGSRMTYGDGNGTTASALVSMDIVGHEITHAVTQHSAGLVYSYESGALNESFSDIFGQSIEFETFPETASWNLGDQIYFDGVSMIRSMSNPNAEGQPDTYRGDHWYTGSGDNGGVHYNSGVQNFWYYLLVEGGAGTNDNGYDYNVMSIGLEAAQQIAYRNLTVYLTSTSDYSDARIGSEQAAIDLFGSSSEEYLAVVEAWNAVGVPSLVPLPVVTDSVSFGQVPVGYREVAEVTFSNQGSGLFVVSDIEVNNDVFSVSDTAFSIGELSSKTIEFYFTPTDVIDTSAFFTVFTNLDTLTIFAQGLGAEPPTLVFSIGSLVDSLYTGDISERQLAIHNSGFSDLEYELSTGLVDDFLGEWLLTYDWNCNGGASGAVVDFLEDHTFATSEGTGGTWSMDRDSIVWVFDAGARYAGNREGNFMSGLMTSGGSSGCWFADKVTDFDSPILLSASERGMEGIAAVPERTVYPKGKEDIGAFNWLYTSVSEGVVAAGDTAYVLITMDAEGLYGGNYETDLSLTSNDPERQLVDIPVSLFVTGAPDVRITPDTLSFWEAFVGYADSLNLVISNAGTDALEVHLYFEDEFFSADSSSLSILPSAGFNLPVYFHPDSVGPFSSELLLVTNDLDQDSIYVHLTGQGIAAPAFGISPDSLGVALSTGDSTVIVLTLDNLEGGSDLIWESGVFFDLEETELYKANEHRASLAPSDGSGNNEGMANVGPIPMESMQALSGTKRILAWTTFTDMDQEFVNTINAISQYYTDYQLSTTITTSAAELGNMLDTVDVFLIPEQEDGGSVSYFENLGISWSEVLESFVRGGGTIILCGDYESGQILNASGLMYMIYSINAYGNTLTLEDSTHYLTTGVTGNLSGQNATFVASISDSLATNLISYSDDAVVAHKRIGRGDVVYISYDYYAYDDNAARVISNAVAGARGQHAWLSLETNAGTIGAGESQDIPVKLNATDLYGGVYRAGIAMQSNDPATQSRTIPVHLEVTGVPVMKVVNDSLHFESVYVGYEKELSVTILNNGTDILTVDVAFSDSTFVTDTLQVSIEPRDTYDLPIYFRPDTAKSYVQSLWLISNDPNQDSTHIGLSGIGVNPPMMSVYPDSLHEALYTGDSSVQTLTIDNTDGGSDLIWTSEVNLRLEESELFKANEHLIQMTPSDGSGYNEGFAKSGPIAMKTMSALTGEVSILSWVGYADIDQEYFHTLNAISQYFADYRLSSTTATSATELGDMLDTVDVFLIPEQEYASNSYFENLGTSWSEVLTTFTERGGTIILCGNPSAFKILDASGLMHMGYFSDLSSQMLTVGDSTHYLTEGLTNSVYAQNATFLMALTDSVASNIVSYNGYAAVAHKKVGWGDVVYIGYDYYYYDDNAARLIANAVAGSKGRRGWLSMEIEGDTIPGGELQEISLSFTATGLYGGEYLANINILSNDPASGEWSIPVVMDVTGAPVLSVNTDGLPFAQTYAGYSDTLSLMISNEGTDDLEITLSLSDSVFAIDTTYLLIAPEDSYELTVYFNPDTAGIFEGNLLLVSNDLDRDSTLVWLAGTGVNPPVMVVSPDSLWADLITDETAIKTLTVDNTDGGSDLVVEFKSRTRTPTTTNTLAHNSGAEPSTTHDSTSVSQSFGSILSDTARVLIIQNSTAWGTDMRHFLQEIFGITAVTVYAQYLSGHDLEPYDLIITTGDQSYDYYEHISSNRERFEEFVENGGVIQYQLATMGSNVNLVGGVHIVYGNGESYNVLNTPDHPIGEHLPLVLEGNLANHTHLTDLPEDATIITSTQYSTVPTTVEYAYGLGKVIATGMTVEYLALSGFNSAPLLGNITSYALSISGQNWLEVPEIDTIPPGEYRDYEVLLDATGLYGGLYSGQVDVRSNDPASPVASVSAGLFVTGIPDIDSDMSAVDFGKTFVGSTATRTVEIMNEGTDTLHVSDVTFDHAAFGVDTTSFYLLPMKTQTLEVSYSPVVAALDTVQMSVLSNDPDEASLIVHLFGRAVNPPIVGVDQDSLSESLLTGMQSTQILTLENTGGSELEWSLEINDGATVTHTPVGFYGSPSPQTEVPELSFEGEGSSFASINKEVLDTLPNFTSNSTGIYVKGDTIYTVNYGEGKLDKYSLHTREVVESFPLHSDPYGITYAAGLLWIGSYDGLVRAYDFNGVYSGSFSTPFTDYPAITFNGTHFILTQAIEYFEPFYVVDFDGTILNSYQGIYSEVMELAWSNGTVWSLTFNGESIVYGLSISDDAMQLNDTIQLSYDGSSYSLAYENRKLYWHPWHQDALVLGVSDYSLNDWLEAGPTQGVLDAGERTTLELSFDAYGLGGELYQKEINFMTNDPATPIVNVPVSLQVTAAPDIDPSVEALSFDQVFVGDSAVRSVTVANVGADELIISLSIDHADFSPSSEEVVIAAGVDKEVFIHYHPGSPGIVSATLTMLSNDPDEGEIQVSLYGEGILPPVISVSPDSISESLILGEQASQNLRIDNTGSGADLIVNLILNEQEEQVRIKASPVFTEAGAQVSKEDQSVADPSENWEQAIRHQVQNIQTSDSVDLVSLKKSLNENYGSITELIANRYDFSEGVEGIGISDGGGDMYDGGNYLATNLGAYIPYSNDLISSHQAFGAKEYFTLKKPGLFVLAANLEQVTRFYITGDLGADGAGSVDGAVIEMETHGRTFLGFVKRVYNSGDPSVNHLIIVEDNGVPTHQFSTNTNIDNHDVNGLSDVHSIHYLLFAGASSNYYDNDAMTSIMSAYLEILQLGPKWLSIGQRQDTIAAGSFTDMAVDFSAAGMTVGLHQARIQVNSNDYVNPMVTVPVTLQVAGIPDIMLSGSALDFGEVEVGQTGEQSLAISNLGTDLLRVSSIASNHPDFTVEVSEFVLAPDEERTLTIIYTPTTVATLTGSLRILSNDPNESDITVSLSGSGIPPSNSPPQLDDVTFSVSENSPGGHLIGALEALDSDGDTLTYRILSGNESFALELEDDGRLLVHDPAQFNYELNWIFELNVEVFDGTYTDTAQVRIDVMDENDPPVLSPQVFEIPENSAYGQVVGYVVVEDEDNDSLEYELIGNDYLVFEVFTTGQLTVRDSSLLNFEDQSSFDLMVVARDYALADTATITVNLTDVNDLPVVMDHSFEVFEHSPAGTVVGHVSATDEDGDSLIFEMDLYNGTAAFEVDPDGKLTVKDSSLIDFEEQGVFYFDIVVTDQFDQATFSVTVTVLDIHENTPPSFNDQTFEIPENSPKGFQVGELRAEDTEDDSLTFTILNSDLSAFEVHSSQLLVDDSSQLDYEVNTFFELVMTVSDGVESDTALITIYLTDVDENHSPVIPDQAFSVSENSPSGFEIGKVVASDPDDDALTFSIVSGNSGLPFTLTSVGQLLINDSSHFDFETTSMFDLGVAVSDGSLADTAMVVIRVIDVNETPENHQPVILDQSFTIEENTRSGVVVGTVVASDEDGDSLTYEIISGNTEQTFTLDELTGILSVGDTTALDYEVNRNISFIVQVRDLTSSDIAIVSVQITDQAEAGPLGLESDHELIIYPNPSLDGHVSIINSWPIQALKLLDTSGKVLMLIDGEGRNEIGLELNHFGRGVYYLIIEDAQGQVIKKVILE
ncbi:choice-of-anchor D domain-containing protein [Marinoscillum sp.]|uniref:Ig-like domain-containing protein n=1 Tax=Marinoscillum sp. TaxID=2024838 RepID=UPI003BA9A90C